MGLITPAPAFVAVRKAKNSRSYFSKSRRDGVFDVRLPTEKLPC